MDRLYPHQERAIAKVLSLGGRCGLFMHMRTGKTRVALHAIRELEDTRVLVVAPLSAVGVWEREVARWAPEYQTVDCAYGKHVGRRARRFATINGDTPTIALVGYESFWREPLRSAILAWNPQAVIFDEAHRLAHRGAKQTRFSHRFAWQGTPHILGLTGTPQPSGPHDLFSIFKAINPEVFGTRYKAFEDLYVTKGGYMGYCQPTGSLVLVVAGFVSAAGNPARLVPTKIEDVRAGDRVVPYNTTKRFFSLRGVPIRAVSKERYRGDLVVASFGKSATRYTPEHKCFVSIRHLYDKYAVYVMRKGLQYRVGSSRFWADGGAVGPLARMRGERADAIWIVSLHDSSEEALTAEHILSGLYGLPELGFHSPISRRREMFERVWKTIGDNSDRGKLCLRDHGRDPNLPFAEKGHRWRYRRQFVTAAANLMTGMSLLQFPGQHRTIDDWRTIRVQREHYNGNVFSLDVPGGLFVSDGVVTHNSIVGYRNLPDLDARVAAHSFRITRAETGLALVEAHDDDLPVALGDKARSIYERLQKKAIAEVEGIQGSGTALSRIAVTNVLRLQQVTSGFVKVTDGREIDFSREKADALRDWLSDAILQYGRLVVFCRFTHDVDATLAVCRRALGNRGEVYQLDGRVARPTRDEYIAAFNASAPSIIVAQIKVASLSIDLSEARAALFYSPDYSWVEYSQCRDRLEAIGRGERREVLYYHMAATGTVDEKIYKVLQRKKGMEFERLDKKRLLEFFS